MNKTIIAFVAAGLLIAGSGVGLLLQQKQNSQLAGKISELEVQIRALAETASVRDVEFEALQSETTRLGQDYAQLRTEYVSALATIIPTNNAPKAMLPNQASILAKLPQLTADAYRTASRGVGPVQRNPLSGVPVHTLTEAQFMALPPLLQDRYIAATEQRAAMLAAERARLDANAQFVLEQKLRELGADAATIESARIAAKNYDASRSQIAAANAKRRATLAQEKRASAEALSALAQERAATATERQASAIEMQALRPAPFPRLEPPQLEPTKVRIVP